MRKLQRVSLSLTVLAAVVSAGCATTHNPAEVCTAEWIKPRADSAVAEIEEDTRSVFNNLRKAAKAYKKGSTPNPLQMFILTRSIKSLEQELKDGRGIKDLKVLRDTCNEPALVADALTDLMKDQGLPDQMISFITKTAIFNELTRATIKRPNPEGTIGT